MKDWEGPGWYMTLGSKKAHYFEYEDSHSLCWYWRGLINPQHVRVLYCDGENRNVCKKCLERWSPNKPGRNEDA